MLDLTRTLLQMGAMRLEEERFEIFGLALRLDGSLAQIVATEGEEPSIDSIAALCKRVQGACLAFGIFAMVAVEGVPDHCLFTMAIEGRCGHAVCSCGLIAKGPDGVYDVEDGFDVPSKPGLFEMVHH